MATMLVDCDRCSMRDLACGDCVMQVLLRAPQQRNDAELYDLDAAEQAAIAVLADSGLVPPLRLSPSGDHTGSPVVRRRAG